MEMVAPVISFNWTLVMQLVTVLVLYLILKKCFFEKVRNFVQKREQSVKDAFDSAEAVNRKADEKMANYEKKIAKAESEGREIVRAYKQKAEAEAKLIIDAANKEASEMILAAEREIEREKAKAVRTMRREISSLALLAAEQIMEKDLEMPGEQERIVDRVIEEAGNTGWKS